MGRSKKNEPTLEDGFWLFFCIFAIFALGINLFIKIIKWIIQLIILILDGIAKIIKYFSNKFSRPKPSTNNVKYREPIKYEKKVLRIPKYRIITPYDNLFSSIVKDKGIEYFKNNKVDNYLYNNQICSADIKGTENYKTSIEFYKNKKIKKVNCSCPYYSKDNTYCKHIYALLLNYCKIENVNGFVNEEYYEKENNENYFNGALAAGFVAHQMHKDNLKKKEQEEKEKIKEEWGLFDWEAELVQKGEYEPWNFSFPGEGDELEDDDWYYEDD